MLARLPLIGVALAVLAGCTAQPPARDPERCLFLFREYDQVEQRYPGGGMRVEGDHRLRPPADLARAAQFLVTAGCQTYTSDLDGMEAFAATLQPYQIVNGPTAIRPVAIHLGALTSITDETRVTIVFRGLGYNSRGVGASMLGRRIYIGPFTSQEAVDQALAVALGAGFIAPYATDYPRF